MYISWSWGTGVWRWCMEENYARDKNDNGFYFYTLLTFCMILLLFNREIDFVLYTFPITDSNLEWNFLKKKLFM